MTPIWKQRPADDNGDVVLLNLHCRTCDRRWTSGCAYWAAEHNASNPGPCFNGVKWSSSPLDPGDFSEACLSRDIECVIGECVPGPIHEALRRIEST